ncbi:DUF3596 domain-containing protein, partial [Aeromonas veronii]|nr:DUF3596 domain-containing protein [Aeromonas veronii]
SVRVYFRFNGELCRKLVPGGNTPENREHAKRLVTVIEYEIQAGTFDYRRHFPESAKLAENTFGITSTFGSRSRATAWPLPLSVDIRTRPRSMCGRAGVTFRSIRLITWTCRSGSRGRCRSD